MATIRETLSPSQYNIAFAPNYSEASSVISQDSTVKLVFFTADIGYILCNRHLTPSPFGSGYLDSVTYNANTDELVVDHKAPVAWQDDRITTLQGFMGKLGGINHFGITYSDLVAAWQHLKGYDFDPETGQKVPRPLGNITELFDLMREWNLAAKTNNLHKTPFESHLFNTMGDDVDFNYDEDAVEEYFHSETGRDLIGYLKALRGGNNMPLAFYKRMISQAYIPFAAPVGSIVTGVWRRFGLPLPPNLVPYSGRSFNNAGQVNPYLVGGNIPNAQYSGFRHVGGAGSPGNVSGSDYVQLQPNNMPTGDMTATVSMKPEGSVSVSSYSGNKTTTSDTHNHRMYGDSASDVRSGGSDTVMNNRDGTQRYDYWWTENDTHNHQVNISHGHSASFTGTQKDYSATINFSSSNQAINVAGKNIEVETYLVVW